MKIENGVQAVLFTPADEAVDVQIILFAALPVLRFQNHLIETETDMIKPQRSNIFDIAFCDIILKMLFVTDGEYIYFFFGDHVEALIVGEQPPIPMPLSKPVKFFIPCYILCPKARNAIPAKPTRIPEPCFKDSFSLKITHDNSAVVKIAPPLITGNAIMLGKTPDK